MPRQISAGTVYIGVDPGKQGGLAVIFPWQQGLKNLTKGGPQFAQATTMPDTEQGIWRWFVDLAEDGYRLVAMIERVHSMPKQGVRSMFTFGQNYGSLRMALTAVGATWEDVDPNTWQRGLNIPLRKETPVQRKLKLKGAAQRLFPDLPIWSQPKSLGKQKAICDALLLAEYCRRTMK